MKCEKCNQTDQIVTFGQDSNMWHCLRCDLTFDEEGDEPSLIVEIQRLQAIIAENKTPSCVIDLDPIYIPFDKLCLGAKFCYDSRKHGELVLANVWVKVAPNEIALWDETNITTNWVGQQICCFSDADEPDLNEEVEIMETIQFHDRLNRFIAAKQK